MKIHKFDICTYNFRPIIEEYLEINDLENIYTEKLRFENPLDCMQTYYHKLYSIKIKTNSKFLVLYNKFINEYVGKIFNFDFLFESQPLIRVHQKNNVSVMDYHIDSVYLAPDGVSEIFKHEINFWMPLTKAYGTNSLWVESYPNKKDYTPIIASYGDLIEFDGANLYHGTEINTTGQTRVSLDFRILPKKIYDKSKKQLSEDTKIFLNDYYSEFEVKRNTFNYF